MQPELITRLIALIQKTGERIVLADPETGRAVVVMDLEQYERLCGAAPAQAPIPQLQTPLTSPTPQQPQRIEPEIPQKIAKPSENPFKKRGYQFGVAEPVKKEVLHDLTQDELLDKINRDIGAWKTAQERKRSDELQGVAQGAQRPEPLKVETVSALEDEERFYLEPIE